MGMPLIPVYTHILASRSLPRVILRGTITIHTFDLQHFRMFDNTMTFIRFICLLALSAAMFPRSVNAEFKAGALVVDVTPTTLPVIINGNNLPKVSDVIKTRLNARALAVSDGKQTAVIVVVDSCMMPRYLIDEAKLLASRRTKIPTNRMLVSATHTHSAGSCIGTLGVPPDENYTPFLMEKLADTIATVVAKLQPAKIGFARTSAPEFTALRRWIHRPDRLANDPFGNPTVRANMHSASNLDKVTGPSGPEDHELSLIGIKTLDDKPIAVLANFSMHYFSGEQGISADYFGLFCEGLKQRIAAGTDFVGFMSHGCSGDIWRRDYANPESSTRLSKIEQYAAGMIDRAIPAYESIEYRTNPDVVMTERRLKMKYRVPDQQRLEWAKRIVDGLNGQPPKTSREIYAREQLILHQRQHTDIVLQALRVGNIAIAATPTETYAITGLKIKAASPLNQTMVIELANGGDGYIPPPEQHLFGGYNTWAARSAGLEVSAEPRVTEAIIEMLEQVAGKPRRDTTLSSGTAAKTIAKLKPIAWWRLDEFAGPRATDSSGNHHDGFYEPAVTYYLEGPHSDRFCENGQTNRAAMFAGGRLRSRMKSLSDQWSISLWLWNGMPHSARDVSGWLFSRGHNHGLSSSSDHLGIGGTSGHTGRLIFFHGNDASEITGGSTYIARWQWNHVAFVRDGKVVRAYLNGRLEFEATTDASVQSIDTLFIGGRSDNHANWEGRLDEVAVFNRSLNAKEISKLSLSASK